MEKMKVGVVGATGMVGQRFLTLLENHPYFEVTALAASASSAGRTYEEAVGSRWAMTEPMPEKLKGMIVRDLNADMDSIVADVDFVFCAVNCNNTLATNIDTTHFASFKKVITCKFFSAFKFQFLTNGHKSRCDDSVNMAVYHSDFVLCKQI